MKKIFLSLTAVVIAISSYGQIAHDLEVYSEDGLLFTLILNGRVMNEEPVSSIQIVNTDKDFIKAVVKFEDENIPDIEKKNLQLANPGNDPVVTSKPVSVVYKVVEKKGSYKLKFASRSNKKIQEQSTVIIQQTQVPVNGRVVISW